LNETVASESWLAKRVENQIKDLTSKKSSHPRIAIAGGVVFTLIVIYLFAHQLLSTGFFTATFGILEMILLYGSLIEWIVVATLEALDRKNISRDIDAFGGIIFVTIGGIWLLVVFPFEFSHFADILPDTIRFLVQWISNDIGRVVLVLWTIVNGVAAVYYGTLRVLVRRKLARA
jgi:hypothetical protein